MMSTHVVEAASITVDVELGTSRAREAFGSLLAHARTLPEAGVNNKKKPGDEEEE